MESQFSKQSELYARYRPDYPVELYDFIFRHLKEKEAAWDCCSGTGQVAKVLATHFDHVYANDISHQQLDRAPVLKNVRYFQVPAEETGFAASLFNLITVAQAIHWLNFEKFYREVRRTSGPRGLLAVIGYGMIRIDDEIDTLIDEFYEFTFSEYFTENRSYLDQKYATIPFPFEEIPAPEFEKRDKWSLEDLEGYVNSWSTVQKFKDEKGVNPADDLIKKVLEVWNEDEKRQVSFPVFLRLGRM